MCPRLQAPTACQGPKPLRVRKLLCKESVRGVLGSNDLGPSEEFLPLGRGPRRGAAQKQCKGRSNVIKNNKHLKDARLLQHCCEIG